MRDVGEETTRVVHHYDGIARQYDARIGIFERLFVGDGRAAVCSRADGDVLEIAVGTGRNLPYYRDAVRLTGIDLSPAMLEIARRRAQHLGREVELQVGDAQALDSSDNQFDTVVCTLALCTVPSHRKAMAEARRVLRPGGRLLLLEHVRSPIFAVRAVQRILNPLTVRFLADHLLRDPLDHLEREGFEIERLTRSKWGTVEQVSARKPA